MPADVISILLSYCIQRARARGSLRNPSMHTVEREAYHWADLGIDTMEEAAAYMQMQLDRQSRVGQIRQALQLGDRKLTPGEEKMVLQWLDWGFGPAEVARAQPGPPHGSGHRGRRQSPRCRPKARQPDGPAGDGRHPPHDAVTGGISHGLQ